MTVSDRFAPLQCDGLRNRTLPQNRMVQQKNNVMVTIFWFHKLKNVDGRWNGILID